MQHLTNTICGFVFVCLGYKARYWDLTHSWELGRQLRLCVCGTVVPLDLACFVWSSLCSSTSRYFVFVLLAVNAVPCCDLCVHLDAAISVHIVVFVADCKLMFFLADVVALVIKK
jgi:hypothetical protein